MHRPHHRLALSLLLAICVIGFGAYVGEGEVIDVYPPSPRDIEVTGRYGQVMCIDEIDTLDVYL